MLIITFGWESSQKLHLTVKLYINCFLFCAKLIKTKTMLESYLNCVTSCSLKLQFLWVA